MQSRNFFHANKNSTKQQQKLSFRRYRRAGKPPKFTPRFCNSSPDGGGYGDPYFLTQCCRGQVTVVFHEWRCEFAIYYEQISRFQRVQLRAKLFTNFLTLWPPLGPRKTITVNRRYRLRCNFTRAQ